MAKKIKTESDLEKLIRLSSELAAVVQKIKIEAEAEDRKQWGAQIEALRAAYPERAHPDGHFFID